MSDETTDSAPQDPTEAADNTGVGETGSFPGEGGAAKAAETVSDDSALHEHADDDGHERTGTQNASEGSA